jgi:hypothetical protein
MFIGSQYVPSLSEKDSLLVQPDFDNFNEVLELEVQKIKWNDFIGSNHQLWDDPRFWKSRKSIKAKSKLFKIFDSNLKVQRRLKVLIRNGVPPELRGKVWWSCSGAAEKMTSSPEQYQDYLHRTEELSSTSIPREIEKDLLRTFPDRLGRSYNDLVSPMSNYCLEELRRVLTAYALRNREIGYCQSMNYIAALLLFHMSEEMAFWCMSAIIEDYLPQHYYSPSLLGGRVDQQVFQTCVAWKLPKLFSKFQATNTVLEPIICPWFLCLYINVLPLYAVCRVWDCFFWEGSTVLFRIGLNLLRSKVPLLQVATDFIEIYSLLKSSRSATHSFELEHHRPSSAGSSSPSDSTTGVPMSDTEFLIRSSFGYKWLRFIPKAKIEILRSNFLSLLDPAAAAASSSKGTAPLPSPGKAMLSNLFSFSSSDDSSSSSSHQTASGSGKHSVPGPPGAANGKQVPVENLIGTRGRQARSLSCDDSSVKVTVYSWAMLCDYLVALILCVLA